MPYYAHDIGTRRPVDKKNMLVVLFNLSHPLYCLYPIITVLNMMDPPATIKQINSDMKEYYEKLVRSSNILLDYNVDNKIGHYWYKYVTRDVLSDVSEENPTHLIQIQVTMNKIDQGVNRVSTPDTTHMITSIGSTSMIRSITSLFLYRT